MEADANLVLAWREEFQVQATALQTLQLEAALPQHCIKTAADQPQSTHLACCLLRVTLT